MKKRLVKYLLVSACIMLLSTCGDEQPGKVQPVTRAPQKAAPAPVADQAPEEEVAEKYVYNPNGKRDPFKNPLQTVAESTSETGVPLTPLQRFDIGQLRLIGVIVGKGKPRAMVIAPDGKSFILSVGTKVGKNDGTVVDITTEAVQVKEKYYDFTGEIRTSIQEIRLPKQGGVK